MRKDDIRVLIKEQFVDCHVQCRNDFLRVANELTVKISVKGTQMTTVQVQERIFQISNLL